MGIPLLSGGIYMDNRLKAVAYARFSSDNQRDESIDAQISAIENYAKINNIEIIGTYIDRAKSATTDQRPNFQKMIADSSTGTFDIIIVHKLDRFARSKYDSAIYKQKLKVNHVRLISVTENIDGSPESIILESVLEAMAEYYSKNLAREVMKGLCENAKNAIHTGGIPPLGYDIKDKKLVINRHEAEAVRIIFDMYNDGYSYGEIIRTLNDNGYKTKIGNIFGKNSLYEILRNEKYMGVLTYNKSSEKSATGTYNRHKYKDNENIIRINGGCPAIITSDVFYTARDRQLYNKQVSQSNRTRQKYLLSSMLYCDVCGSPLYANRRKKDSQITYRCCKKYRSVDKCTCKEINQQWIDSEIIKIIKKHILNEQNVDYILQTINDYNNSQKSKQANIFLEYTNELTDIKNAKENILNAVEEGFAKEHFKHRLDTLIQRESYLKHQLHTMDNIHHLSISKTDILLISNKFNRLLKENDITALRAMLNDFIDKIYIGNNKVTVYLKERWFRTTILTLDRY